MQNSSMTDIIYDYFTSRILFGYFLPGDRLPSVNYICRQFQVSALTVRAVFARMRKDGYIKTAERRLSIVIYKPDPERECLYRRSFLSRKEGMEDVYRYSIIIFGPIVRFYLQKQNEDSIKQIRSQLKKIKGHPAKQITMFYAEAMRPLNNPLVLNLHWEIARYLRTPYLERPADFGDKSVQSEEHIKRMLKLIELGDAEKALDATKQFSSDVMQLFFESLSAVLDGKRSVEQEPFRWQIYWEHPQLCYTLATEIMSKIDACVYKHDRLLPSCRSLAREYGASLITMRRTLKLLNDICVIETQNGVGTKIIYVKPSGSPDFSHPQIRKCLLLFLQALQISALTCKNVAVHTLSSLDDKDLRALECKIGRNVQDILAYQICETCLSFIGENSPSAFIREVYSQLHQLLLWGHALHLFSQKLDTIKFYEAYACKLRRALGSRDVSGFADLLSELLGQLLKAARNLLLELGFTDKQLV